MDDAWWWWCWCRQTSGNGSSVNLGIYISYFIKMYWICTRYLKHDCSKSKCRLLISSSCCLVCEMMCVLVDNMLSLFCSLPITYRCDSTTLTNGQQKQWVSIAQHLMMTVALIFEWNMKSTYKKNKTIVRHAAWKRLGLQHTKDKYILSQTIFRSEYDKSPDCSRWVVDYADEMATVIGIDEETAEDEKTSGNQSRWIMWIESFHCESITMTMNFDVIFLCALCIDFDLREFFFGYGCGWNQNDDTFARQKKRASLSIVK